MKHSCPILMIFLVFVSLVQAHNFVAHSFTQADDIVCPNGWKCDDESTCCQLPDGDWGCCVFKDAQCCADHTHCCPPGTECDVKNHQCKAKITNQTIPAVRTKRRSVFPGIESKDKATVGMTCPDHSVCPLPHAACCRHFTGRFTCCNYPNNVCCDGGSHCCPIGTVCDAVYYTCVAYPSDVGPLAYGWASVIMPPKYSPARQAAAVTKDDGEKNAPDSRPAATDVCPDGSKCCIGQNGGYGRCILDDLEAVCCSDGLHCCPQGSKCDVVSGQCVYDKRQTPITPWATRVTTSTTSETVPCPDGSSQCPDGNTCCPLANSKWGCCPLPEATCCSDKEHCCPHGTRCDVGGSCITNVQSKRIPWSSLVF